ncbi:hypothetical protein ACHQM5_019299 [Ranunculus cassubicifolius]
MSTSLEGDAQSVYVLKLSTSSMFGSGLSDLGAGILLCLIDENGDSVLQRISASSVGTLKEGDLQEICFQRGSVDEFIFKGPKLERIKALWVGLESGRWRLGGVSLTTIHGRQDQSEDAESDNGLHYAFESEDIPIGEGEDTSIIELKPTHITELSGLSLLNLSTTTQSNTNTLLNLELLNQESMKEYADLKSSLLLYDSLLIFAGTSISAIFFSEKAGLAFLTGGVLGFLYLLLLQKSVDGLPSSASMSTNVEEDNVFDRVLKQLKNPVTSLALAVAIAGVAVRYGSGDMPIELTAQEILVGMTGFLVCKVAVLLAAFKPTEMELQEKK